MGSLILEHCVQISSIDLVVISTRNDALGIGQKPDVREPLGNSQVQPIMSHLQYAFTTNQSVHTQINNQSSVSSRQPSNWADWQYETQQNTAKSPDELEPTKLCEKNFKISYKISLIKLVIYLTQASGVLTLAYSNIH